MKIQSSKFKVQNFSSKLKSFGFFVALLIFIFCLLPFTASKNASALTRQLPLSGQLLTPAKMAVPDGDYTMRFSIYTADRAVSDSYPSDSDSGARVWTETQTVKVERGLWKVTLGSATALPDTLNFETGNYFLGIRINTDPEMVPRKKILPVPLALNAESLGGAKPGTGNNDILQLDSAGAINIAGNITTAGILQGANLIVGTAIQLPANSILTADIMDGTISTIDLADGLITSVKISDSSITSAKLSDSAVSGAKLADSAVTVSKIGDGAITTIKLSDGSVSTAKLADLSVTTAKVADASITAAKLATGDLHFQNTDTGTTSLSFGLGTGAVVGTNNFSLTASNAANKPTVRYNGATGKWQISNDGATFADIASAISATLQGAYDAGNTITTTDARNLIFNLADTATDSSFIVNIQGAANVFQIQDAGTPIFTVADGGLSTFGGNINLSGNRIVSTSRIDGYPGSNFMSARVDLTYGSYSSIILDSSDLPHIAYQRNWDDLSIADWDGAQWTITNIDTTGDRGEQADFVIDNAGIKHISYSDNYTTGSPGVDDDDLMYAKYVGMGGNCSGSSAWQCTLIDATGNIGNLGTSIDFDASNNPHISYYDQTNTNLKHAWFVGGSGGTCAAVGGSAAWNCEIVEAANDVGRFSAIVINRATGDIHITYFDNTNSDLRYIKYSGSAWGASDLLDGRTGCIASGCATSGTVGGYSYGSNLILDSSGNPRIAYYNASGGDLYYASYNGTAWTTSIVEGGAGATGSGCTTSGDYGERQSLDLDSNNNPHIAYHVHSGLEDLRYASYSGSSWTCQTIDSSGNLADYTSIQVTTANKIYISYSDSTNSDLKLASNNYPKLNIYGDVAIMGETGNLGIGTLAPTERLEVVGGIKASGNISGDNITASNDLTANDDLIVSDDGWIPTLFGSSSNNGALTLNSTSATPKGDIYINPGGQKTVIGDSIASGSLATAGLQIAPNYLYIQYRYYNPGTGYTYSGNTGEANSYGGTPFTLVSAVGDMAYFGSYQPFNSLGIALATAGVGGAVAWEYYNGASWVSLAGLSDNTSNLTQDGIVAWTTTLSSSSVNGYSAYWVRANVSATGYTTAPTADRTLIGQFGSAAAPLVASLIQPAGIADSTSWSATGTMLGINTPSSFNGNFVDLQVNGSSKFIVTSAGNVGIGTANPNASLDVRNSIQIEAVGVNDPTVRGHLEIHQQSNGANVFWAHRQTDTAPTGNFIQFQNAAITSTLFQVDVSGNISTGGGGLDTNGGSINLGSSNIINTDASSWIKFSAEGGSRFVLDSNNSASGSDTDDFSVYRVNTSGTPLFRIQGAGTNVGNVGIGTASPGEKLEVVGNIISKGTSWTSRTSAANNDWLSVAYGNGLFVAVATSGTNDRVMTSPDGINWTLRTSAANNEWRFITYGNGLFVAVASSGAGNRVMTSPDGINWTTRTSADDHSWRSIAYGNGLFVAVACGVNSTSCNATAGNRVMTSPDGITWTSRADAADNEWRSITYGNGLFVAVATTGTGDRVMTSSNGVTWTTQANPVDNAWQEVTYGNGLFVAVSTDGTGNRVMTSPNGTAWTSRTSAADNDWSSVAYGNGLFVAVACGVNSTTCNATAGNRVMTSPDGITWTSRTSAADNSWNSVAYGNGMFVTVANTGTSDRVMTSGKTELNALAHNNIYQGGMNIFGNVVIGIPSTTGNIFELKGVAAFEADNSNQNIYIQNTSGVNVGKINSYPSSVVFAGENNADAYFTDDSLNGIIVKDGGNVGIGTITPAQKFTVNGGVFLQTPGGNPTVLGSANTGGLEERAIAISGKYAYIGRSTTGAACSSVNLSGCEFQIYDISNPASPVGVGGVDITTTVYAVSVSGDYAYVANNNLDPGNEIQMINISNPFSPQVVGGIDVGTTIIDARSIYIAGKYAYFGTYTLSGTCSGTTLTGCEFRIYDISNPASPIAVGGIDVGGWVWSINVSGRYAYLTTSAISGTCSGTDLTGCEVRKYDISNSASPTAVAGADIGQIAYDAYVSGKYIYAVNAVANGTCSGTTLTGCEFRVYDINDFSSISGIDIGLAARSIEVAGKYAYTTNDVASGTCSSTDQSGCEMRIYDISNQAAPSGVGGYDMGAGLKPLAIFGKYAYVGSETIAGNEFNILDISGMDSPAASIGTIAANTLQVAEDASFGNSLNVKNSVNVGGGGILSQGPLALFQNINGGQIISALRATDSSPTGNFIQFQNAAGNATLFGVGVNGNVGIGTDPSTVSGGTLRVNGDIEIITGSSNDLYFTESSVFRGNFIYDTTDNAIIIGTANASNAYTKRLKIYGEVDNPNIEFTNIANVGIGAASPTAKLQVQGTSTSSGATTMTASNGLTTFTTSASITINAGDYIIPTTTTGQARSVTIGGTGTSFTVTPAFSADVGIPTPETFTIYPAITNLTDNSGNTGLFLQGGTRDVGIGTTTPMTGPGRDQTVESGATIYSGSKAAFLQIKGVGNTNDFSSITLESDEATDKAWQITHRKLAGNTNNLMWWYFNGTTWTSKMTLSTGGNLGLVSGSSISVGQSTNIITDESSYNLKFSSSSGSRFVLDSDNSGTGDDFNVYRVNTSGTPLFNIQGAGTNVGNVGINTSTPSGNLDIRQIADGNQVIYARRNTDTSPTGNFIQFQNAAGTSDLFIVNVNGFLGLGATPDYRLDVREGSGGSIGNAVRLQNNGTATNNSGTQLLFAANRTTSGLTNIAGVAGLITDITQTAYKGALIFSTADNAAPAERARIDNVGNVSFGVNVTGGTTTIDLGGTGTGNAVCHTTQTGTDNEGLVDCTSGPIADYAEMYPVAGGIDYGDIVAVGTKMLKTKDGDNIAQLVKASTPYQSTTIGIVSNNYGDFTSAGYNIKKEDNPMPVALNGRVPVKVSLENGPIAVGDPLTSSSEPGVAMKATGAGYVIGKALEPFDESGARNQESGKILVFVNPGWYNPPTGPLVQGGSNEFDAINVGGLAMTKDLVVTGLARIKGDLIVEGKVKGDLEVEGVVKTKGIVGGWRSYENHFLNSKFENDFTASLLADGKSAASWEYHKVKLATDPLVGSKAQLDHAFNFKPADDEIGATWRFMLKIDGSAAFSFGLRGDDKNYAAVENGTDPNTVKFATCLNGECTITDNIAIDPSLENHNYIIMIKAGEAKLLINGQEYAKHATNVPADSILHFHEEVATNIDAIQSTTLDYLGVIVGRYETF